MTNNQQRGIVYIVSGHSFLSTQLKDLLAQEPSMEVRLTSNAQLARDVYDGVVVIDQATLKDPIDVAMRRIAIRFPAAKLMVIAESEASATTLLAIQRLGIHGWIRQEDILACLVPTILAVRQGLRCARTQDSPVPAAVTEKLSEGREREVFEMLLRGCPNREIALGIGIGESTVKTHVSNIFKKLGIRRRRELALDRVAVRRAE